MVKKVLLLYGGRSGECEVSCVSAKFLESVISKAGYETIPVFIDQNGAWHLQKKVEPAIASQEVNPCHFIKSDKAFIKTSRNDLDFDFVFPIIHGTTGEDGKLQGMLEFFNIPYAGSGVLSSSLCMDKYLSKEIFENASIPIVKYAKYDLPEWEKDRNEVIRNIKEKFGFPLFIKPTNMGSSVGVSRVTSDEEITKALELGFSFDDQVICEAGHNVREVEVAVFGNYPEYKVSIPGEIIPKRSFYSYEAKYLDEDGASLVIGPDLSESTAREIEDIAKEAFRAVRGDGFARIDFFVDKDSNKVYLNEINTLPGFTPISMFPMLWEKSGVSHEILIKTIIQLGVDKFQAKNKLKTVRQ